MRISGFASGLDIDSIVKQLMTAQKAPLDKLNQQKQLVEWKREDYRTVSTKLVTFQEKLSSLSLSSAIDAKKTVISGASNVLTAKPTGAASNSVLNVEVISLAKASTTVLQGTAGATKISDIYAGGYNGADNAIKIGEADPIVFNKDDTIDSLINKINSNSKTGVTAVYDTASGKLSFTSKATGKDNTISLSGGLVSNSSLVIESTTPGTDAEVIINGIKTTQSSNRFTVNGLEISLNGTTPQDQSTQIEVTQDVDKTVETIKEFVNAYNDTLSYLNSMTSQERYRTYLPLTTEQKEAMSESEIKLWEEKSKSGMLKNDSILNNTISQMRLAVMSDFTSDFTLPDGSVVKNMNLTNIGITTGDYQQKGKLQIDENKLRAAIEANPDQVASFFKKVDGSSNTGYTQTDGLFNRLKKIEQDSLKLISEKAGTSRFSTDPTTAFLPQSEMGDQLKSFDKRISDVQLRLNMLETRYYRQFTAMETAMNKYNSISSSLSSFIS
ncbi:flagellar filament capping protein FliD [Paenibacillus sp. PDC88]|uniref:flagellar filament capping protein FliD n=1 Tax=Paenibacillus sp. PDC88 TaxID=1884375 RepID=UPI000894E8EE|nr:flagellar filament capping protein FliD [Paenibacillus sp. PDC88]SDW83725.1 flagellar hook-associated protein 2 [Paenibacillus sp. PDC88]